jgi:HEPN domain-containing protein
VKPEVITFIEIAKNDFEAAKILFREELYLQAIFMLQQSLEKAIKALLLKFGIVDSEEALKYEIGHNVVKNTLQLMAEMICNGIKEIQKIQKQYKDLRTLLQKVEEYAKFACEQYIREKDYLFKQIENFKDKVFEPINEENKKIINMVVDSVSVLSSLLTLPFDELFESILRIISQHKELIKSNNNEERIKELEEQIKELQTNINLAIDLTLLLTYHIPFDSSIIEELRYRRSRIEENTILIWWSKQIMDLMLRANMFERIKGLILGVPP